MLPSPMKVVSPVVMNDFLRVDLGTPMTAGNSTQGPASVAKPALKMACVQMVLECFRVV
jgi:hypothetical protein